MSEEPPRYLAYMLRVWQAGKSGRLAWRASLESPHTGERHTFTTLESLCAFLHETTGLDSPALDGDGRASALDAALNVEPAPIERLCWASSDTGSEPTPSAPPNSGNSD